MKYSFKLILILSFTYFIFGCSTVEEKADNTAILDTPKEEPKILEPEFDSQGCVVKRENLEYKDIIQDEVAKKYYTPEGNEISLLDVIALYSGTKICPYKD